MVGGRFQIPLPVKIHTVYIWPYSYRGVWKRSDSDPSPREPYQPAPIPLLANTSVVAQPAGLYTLASRYSAAATGFIESSAAAAAPFLLYLPFNHIHAPSSCGEGFCGRSSRGPIGDATEEVDSVVGDVMAAVRASANNIGSNTLVFFTSDNGAPMRPGALCVLHCAGGGVTVCRGL